MPTAFSALGGIRALNTIAPRILAPDSRLLRYAPQSLVIDGTKSRDPDNTGSISLLRAGLLMGKVTTTNKYASSILGLTTKALGGGQTSVTLTAQAATELARRIGTSGTFTLTGENAAGAVARQRTITYSAVNTSTGVVTTTADVAAAVSAVNQINSLITVDSSGSGTFTITVEGITTGAITYNATVATLITNINTALNATFGTSAIVASGASLAALVLTFSGTGYSGRPVGLVQATLLTGATGFTMNGSGTVNVPSTSPATTAGVTAVAADEGEFVAGSLIGDVDGSQNPNTILGGIGGVYGVDVNDLGSNSIDQQLPQFFIGGDFYAAMIINLTACSAGAQAWIKSTLNAGRFTFDNDR